MEEQAQSRAISSNTIGRGVHANDEPITLRLFDCFYSPTNIYTGVVFVFRKNKSQEEISYLKSGFEKAMELFYPYLGSLHESSKLGVYEIRWNEESGAVFEYYEDDNFKFNFNDFSENETQRILLDPLPSHFYPPHNTHCLAGVRITNLKEGSVICIRLSHSLGDGTTSFNFMQYWWSYSREEQYKNNQQENKIVSVNFPIQINPNLLHSNVKSDTIPACLQYLPFHRSELAKPNPDFNPIFNRNLLFISDELLTYYKNKATERNERLSNNDIICSILLKSYAYSATYLTTVICVFPINLRGRKEGVTQGYFGCALAFGRIEEEREVLINSTVIDVALLFRKEINKKCEINEIDSLLGFFQNCEKTESLYFSFKTNFVITSWYGFPLYSPQLDEEDIPISSSPELVDKIESFKVIQGRGKKDVWIYSLVNTEHQKSFLDCYKELNQNNM